MAERTTTRVLTHGANGTQGKWISRTVDSYLRGWLRMRNIAALIGSETVDASAQVSRRIREGNADSTSYMQR